jgi:O-antigen ligase
VIDWLNSLCLILPLNNVLSSIWAVVGIIVFISQVIRGKIEQPNFDLPGKKLWLLFSGWLLFTTLFAFDRSVALLGLLDFLPFIIFALIVSEVVKTEIQREQITQNLIVSTIPISLFGLFQVVFDQADLHLPRLFSSYIIPLGKSPDGRILSLFGHFNELGIFLVMILPLMIHGIVTKEERKRWISIVALPIGLICLFFSGSRNAWAVSTIGIIILTIFYGFWLGLGVILTGIITLVSAVWLPFAVSLRVLFPPRLIDRLLSTFDPQKTDFFSTVSRWNAWQIAIDLIGQSPIVGWGLRNFTVVARAQSQELFGLPHVHNLYLSIAVGAGLPGLILFLLAMFYTIRPKTDRTPLTFILQLSILLFLTSSILDITLYEPRISLLFWLIVGMLL